MDPYILVIEDDPILKQLALKAAEQMNILAVSDENGDQVAAITQQHGPPALVLLDLHLPFATGADILKHMRSDAQLSHVPVIITTADILQARDLQAKGEQVLLKPFSMSRLQDLVAQFLPQQ